MSSKVKNYRWPRPLAYPMLHLECVSMAVQTFRSSVGIGCGQPRLRFSNPALRPFHHLLVLLQPTMYLHTHTHHFSSREVLNDIKYLLLHLFIFTHCFLYWGSNLLIFSLHVAALFFFFIQMLTQKKRKKSGIQTRFRFDAWYCKCKFLLSLNKNRLIKPCLVEEGRSVLGLFGKACVQLLGLRQFLHEGLRLLRFLLTEVLEFHLDRCETRVQAIQLIPNTLQEMTHIQPQLITNTRLSLYYCFLHSVLVAICSSGQREYLSSIRTQC